VVAGAVGVNARELGYNTSFVYPRLGVGELSRAMHRALPGIELVHAPERIDHKKRRLHFFDQTVDYDVLVSSAPLPVLLGLLQEPPEAVRRAAAKLRCTHLWYLDVALDRAAGKDLHWIYVPEAKYPFYRVGCYSHFSPQMAPPGKAGLYVELADRDAPTRQAPARRRPRSGRDGIIDSAADRLCSPPTYRVGLRDIRPRLLSGARGDPALLGASGHHQRRSLRTLELLVDGGRAALRPSRRTCCGGAIGMTTAKLDVSIVIPVYNEEAILHAAVVDLRSVSLPRLALR
jgi:hypothetical protein